MERRNGQLPPMVDNDGRIAGPREYPGLFHTNVSIPGSIEPEPNSICGVTKETLIAFRSQSTSGGTRIAMPSTFSSSQIQEIKSLIKEHFSDLQPEDKPHRSMGSFPSMQARPLSEGIWEDMDFTCGRNRAHRTDKKSGNCERQDALDSKLFPSDEMNPESASVSNNPEETSRDFQVQFTRTVTVGSQEGPVEEFAVSEHGPKRLPSSSSVTGVRTSRQRPSRGIQDPAGQVTPASVTTHNLSHEAVDEKNEDWDICAENAYGAFIHVSLQFGLCTAIYKCGPMLVASVLIQFAFSYELFRALPALRESETVCEIPWDLQLSAVGVFVILMLNNVPGMITACSISLLSQSYENDSEGISSVDAGQLQRCVTWVLGVLTELLTWGSIFCSGILFIMTSPSVDMVIRSTVAIIFVQNVDEIIFESCCSKEIKESLGESRYNTSNPLQLLGLSPERARRAENLYALFVHLPVVTAICAAVVFGTRTTPGIECEDHVFW